VGREEEEEERDGEYELYIGYYLEKKFFRHWIFRDDYSKTKFLLTDMKKRFR